MPLHARAFANLCACLSFVALICCVFLCLISVCARQTNGCMYLEILLSGEVIVDDILQNQEQKVRQCASCGVGGNLEFWRAAVPFKGQTCSLSFTRNPTTTPSPAPTRWPTSPTAAPTLWPTAAPGTFDIPTSAPSLIPTGSNGRPTPYFPSVSSYFIQKM